MVERYRDTLLSQSKIWLFGRVLGDITLNTAAYKLPSDPDTGNLEGQAPYITGNDFVRNQLKAELKPKFARIFAFSYEAAFYELPRPAIFLVHGDGIDADTPDAFINSDLTFLNRAPASFGRTGLATQAGSFAASVQAWAYDRADFTMRLDADTGTFDALLLGAELATWDGPARSAGSVARAAGSVARAAGSVARAAGSVARTRRSSDE